MITLILAYIHGKYNMSFSLLYLGTVLIDLSIIDGMFGTDIINIALG